MTPPVRTALHAVYVPALPVLLLAYLAYWLVRHLSGGGKRSRRKR